MARIRTIKPDFWTDEKLGEVSRDARLLFAGLFSNADCSGRIRGHPASLSATVFPYDTDATLPVVSGWVQELLGINVVYEYTVRGQKYLQVVNFKKHQKIDNPSRRVLPGPDECNSEGLQANPREGLANPSETLANCRETLALDREGEGYRYRDQEKKVTKRSLDSEAIDRVVEHYRSHHPRARPGKKERKLVADRMRDGYSADDLCKAIDGNHMSPFHCGDNAARTRYHKLALILRDSSQVLAFMDAVNPKAPVRRSGNLTANDCVEIAMRPEGRATAQQLDSDMGDILALPQGPRR